MKVLVVKDGPNLAPKYGIWCDPSENLENAVRAQFSHDKLKKKSLADCEIVEADLTETN